MVRPHRNGSHRIGRRDRPRCGHGTSSPDVLWILTDDQRYDSIRAFNRICMAAKTANWVRGISECRPSGEWAPPSSTPIARLRAARRRGPRCITGVTRSARGLRVRVSQQQCRPLETDLPEHMAELGTRPCMLANLEFVSERWRQGRENEIYQTDINFKTLAQRGLSDGAKSGQRNEREEAQCAGQYGVLGYAGRKVRIHLSGAGRKDPDKGTRKDDEKYDLLRNYNEEAQAQIEGMIIGGVSPQLPGKTRDGYYHRFSSTT